MGWDGGIRVFEIIFVVRMGLVWCFHGPKRLAHVNYFTTQIKEALIRLFFQDLTPGQKPR